jgi:hypothetical protein
MLAAANDAIRSGALFVVIDDIGAVLFTASTPAELISFWEFPDAAALVVAGANGKHQLLCRPYQDPVGLVRAAGSLGWDVGRHP